VNCNRLSFFAASRTLCRPLNALPQLCVWVAVVCPEFSLADRLPSAPSADGFPSLFGHFVGTTRSSDSLPTCMLDFWLITFSSRPVHYFVSGIGRASRFSHVEFPNMQGSQTSQSPMDARIPASTDVVFRLNPRRRHSDLRTFRGSIPCLCSCQCFACSLATVPRA